MASDLRALQLEHAKHSAAASAVQQRIAEIEEAERLKREAKEKKEQALANLRAQVERCQGWIKYFETQIAEIRTEIARQVDVCCAASPEVEPRLRGNLRELATHEAELAVFRNFETSLQAGIEAIERQP